MRLAHTLCVILPCLIPTHALWTHPSKLPQERSAILPHKFRPLRVNRGDELNGECQELYRATTNSKHPIRVVVPVMCTCEQPLDDSKSVGANSENLKPFASRPELIPRRSDAEMRIGSDPVAAEVWADAQATASSVKAELEAKSKKKLEVSEEVEQASKAEQQTADQLAAQVWAEAQATVNQVLAGADASSRNSGAAVPPPTVAERMQTPAPPLAGSAKGASSDTDSKTVEALSVGSRAPALAKDALATRETEARRAAEERIWKSAAEAAERLRASEKRPANAAAARKPMLPVSKAS
eukprot:2935818-Pleurochrysis_carterae.AAC.5